MDFLGRYQSPFGYMSGDNGIDSYGVDHSGFSTQDELQYQTLRTNREKELANDMQKQGIADSDYPQYGTSFWQNAGLSGGGLDMVSISPTVQAALNLAKKFPAQNQQSQVYENNAWDTIKNWGENFADTTQAASVGYTTGLTLGNFDEIMGGATALLSGNRENYVKGRDATRQLQNDLSQRHPYLYGGAEFVGAMTTPMHLFKGASKLENAINAATDTLNASAGYAENWKDFGTNLAVNGAANMAGLALDKIPYTRGGGIVGQKFIKQGINSFADKMKNVFYKNDDEEEK